MISIAALLTPINLSPFIAKARWIASRPMMSFATKPNELFISGSKKHMASHKTKHHVKRTSSKPETTGIGSSSTKKY